MRYVIDGPGTFSINPFYENTVRTATLLSHTQYAKLLDVMTGLPRVVEGPQLIFAGAYEEVKEVLTKQVLQKDEYLKVENLETGVVRIIQGETVFVPAATDRLVTLTTRAVTLTKFESILVTDSITGAKRVEIGPQLVFPGPYDQLAPKQTGIQLGKEEYVVVTDKSTGSVRVEEGEQILFLGATEQLKGAKKKGTSLSQYESVKLKDSSSGKLRVEVGPKLVIPGPYETVLIKREGIKLSKTQWVRIMDETSGKRYVVKGEMVVYLGPTEKVIGAEVNEAYDVTPEQGVLVESTQTGQQRLVTKNESGAVLFFPSPYENVIEIRPLIRVEAHEAMVVLNDKGVYTFYGGASTDPNATKREGTSFFLAPHSKVVQMHWSHGGDKTNREVLDKVDLRAQYLQFEYNVRTVDNVQMKLQGLIFWQVLDVAKMVRTTQDARGDVWNHARNTIIQAISQVTLKEFMTGFNEIVSGAANETDSSFYDHRGVSLQSMEVTAYECVDEETANVLQDIIRQTTNRINELQKQESANEIAAAKLDADIKLEAKATSLLNTKAANEFAVLNTRLQEEIKLEERRKELLEQKAINQKLQAVGNGEASGLKVSRSAAIFFDTIKDSLDGDTETTLQLYQLHQQLQSRDDTTANLAGGSAKLFVTPADFNLRLDTGMP